MRRQRGLSLIGLIVVGGLLVFAALLAMKLLPVYMEYFTIKKHVTELARSSAGASIKEIQNNFDKRALVDDITALEGPDLEITKFGEQYQITASYSKKVPLFANISVLVDFEATGR
ncbi:MAG: DUF4845 domain-containing protein [Burkholderiales bacterium]|nr:DUF4845 domain-containing protein [Burkholderiales bacterium]